MTDPTTGKLLVSAALRAHATGEPVHQTPEFHGVVRGWRQAAAEYPAKHMKQDENGEWVPVGKKAGS